jgi:hypothetical protein
MIDALCSTYAGMPTFELGLSDREGDWANPELLKKWTSRPDEWMQPDASCKKRR